MQKQYYTSWQKVGKWYNELVSDKGHYYHQHVIIPHVLRLLNLQPESRILDLACGQGVLARSIPKNVEYVGIDAAKSLIETAIKLDKQASSHPALDAGSHQEGDPDRHRDDRNVLVKNSVHQFLVGDIIQPLPIDGKKFSHATIILALQNIEKPEAVLQNATKQLAQNGKLVIILNHPCFRIPRQSSWQIDEKNKLEYRRVNRYLTPLKIPINMNPGKTAGPVTWSFHFPISTYSEFLASSGFTITKIEEWASDKVSVGKAAKMENRSRSEFPLFLTIIAQKV